MSLILACSGCNPPDLGLAEALPFAFYWTVAFLIWTGVATFWSLVVRVQGRSLGMWPLGWLALAVLGAGLTGSFMLPMFLLLPLWVMRLCHGLTAGSIEGARFHRAFLIAIPLLIPVAFLRVYIQWGRLVGFDSPVDMFDRPVVCLGILVAFGGFGYWRGLPRVIHESVRVGRWRSWRQVVAVQRTQCCPICWDLVEDEDGSLCELSICSGCHTVMHRDCTEELGRGYCVTLGCRRREAARPVPPARVIRVGRPRLGPVLTG